jgi:hypothetical protein
MLVTYLGYSVMVYGLDHVGGACTPFGCTVLGQFAGKHCPSGSVPCHPVKSGTTTKSLRTPAGGTAPSKKNAQGNSGVVNTPHGPMYVAPGTYTKVPFV